VVGSFDIDCVYIFEESFALPRSLGGGRAT
jgi:hypothetical protein